MRRLLIILALIFCMPVVLAETETDGEGRLGDLYATEIEVASDSPDIKDKALQQGLVDLLSRLSGRANSAVVGHAKVKEALTQISRFVVETRYRSVQIGQQNQTLLWVKYNLTQVNQLLTEADLPLWSDKRPTVVVWIAVEDGQERYLLGADSDKEAKYQVEAQAKRWGFPVVFPLMDLEDQAKVRFSDVASGFGDPIKRASERYASVVVLIGTLSRHGSDWRGRWSMIMQSQTRSWDSSAKDLGGVVGGGFEKLTERVASNMIKAAPVVVQQPVVDDGSLKIAISNIQKLADYNDLLTQLGQHRGVKDVQVIGVDAQYLVIALDLNSEAGGVAAVVADAKLKPDQDSAETTSDTKTGTSETGAATNTPVNTPGTTSTANPLPTGMMRYRYVP